MFGVAVLFACLALCHGGAVLPVVAPVHHAAVVAPVPHAAVVAPVVPVVHGFAGHGLAGAGYTGAGYGAGLGAGYGAGLGAGYGAGYGVGAGYGAGVGAGYGAGYGVGAGYGAGVGAGLGAHGLAGAGHHILKRSPTFVAPVVAPVAHHVAPVAVSHQSRFDLSQYGTSVIHSAALPVVKPVVAPVAHGAHGFGAGYGYY